MSVTFKKQGRRQRAGGKREEDFTLFLPFIAGGTPPVRRFQEKLSASSRGFRNSVML